MKIIIKILTSTLAALLLAGTAAAAEKSALV
jgi:hypothetical protein